MNEDETPVFTNMDEFVFSSIQDHKSYNNEDMKDVHEQKIIVEEQATTTLGSYDIDESLSKSTLTHKDININKDVSQS